MSANDQQVGGSHYAGDYQHWDWVFDTTQTYHEARATAYVARYRKKNGMEDLHKGLHFVDKCTELYGRSKERERRHYKDLKFITGVFCDKNGLEGEEYHFMAAMVYGRYDVARAALLRLISALERTDPTKAPQD